MVRTDSGTVFSTEGPGLVSLLGFVEPEFDIPLLVESSASSEHSDDQELEEKLAML